MKLAVLLWLCLVSPVAFCQQPIAARALLEWEKWGGGTCIAFQDGVLMHESDNSKGLMLVSPHNFANAFVLRFSMVALTASTVMITVLQAADTALAGTLTIPSTYDGSMDIWNTGKASYFVVFRNAPHGSLPYINKQPSKMLVTAQVEDNMLPGKRYLVEVGVNHEHTWLNVDGQLLVQSRDTTPYPGGRFAFRIRGLPGLPAACLLREISYQPL